MLWDATQGLKAALRQVSLVLLALGSGAYAVTTAESQHTESQHTELRLPFEGTWIVGQGYHGSESHHGAAAFALDLVKLGARDQAYARRGRHRDDWYGVGSELLATAGGVVVRAVDHHPDNRVVGPSTRSNRVRGNNNTRGNRVRGNNNTRANTVVIQHRVNEFSEYVHLQHGSLRVAVGDAVVAGQVLARCGNSGSETPHLHWALLSSLDPIRTRPAVFTDYEVRDEQGTWQPAQGTPQSGQVIRNPPR